MRPVQWSDHTVAVTASAETCLGCGAPVDEAQVREDGAVERFSCMRCGLQLVRRPGQGWESIRG